jgi:type VI secretion system secreted protein Hcp
MALNAYLTLTGQNQGVINGSVTLAGRENQIAVYGWSHELVSPRDSTSGLPTGKRQHVPFTITKPIDKASVPMAQAMVMNENLTSVVLRAWRTTPSGKEQHYYTVKLTNASISQIQSEMLNNQYAENMKLEVREHVSFTYQSIEWTWEEGGLTLQDDWADTEGMR